MSNLPEAVASGDRVAALEQIRDLLGTRLEEASPAYAAGIAKQLSAVMAELAMLNPPKQESTVDDLARKRSQRRAAVSDDPAPRKQRRRRGRGTSGVGGPDS